MRKSVKQSLKAGIIAGIFAFSFSPAAPVIRTAQAIDWTSFAGAGIQYIALEKEIKYLDNDGRNEFFEQMKKKYGVNDDPRANAMLDRIMTRLSASIAQTDSSIVKKPYNYFVNNDTSFNAFCTLGHNMSVNTGLYNYLNNEDEIAVVLAHEMGHGQKDHPAKGMKRSLGPAILASATGSVLGAIAANIWNGQGLTKPMEWEADNLAFDYISRSPYNPGATAAVWQRIIDMDGNNSSNVIAIMSGAADHPSNASRRDNYAKKLTEMSGGKVTVNNGTVYINKKEFVTPAPAYGMTSAERAYFVMGNLAAAYKNGHAASDAYADGSTVMLGAQPIITAVNGDRSASDMANQLNKIK